MRLLVLTNTYHPDRAGGAAIYTDFSRAMAARGHDVTVRAAYPYFPEWTDKSGRNGWRRWRYVEAGVAVERHGQRFPEGGIRCTRDRLVFEGSHFLSQLRSLWAGRFDAVLVFATNPGTTAAAVAVAAARRIPMVVSVQDLAGDAAGAIDQAAGGSARLFQWLERALLGRANLLYGISPGMADRLREILPSGRIEYVPNWLNDSMAVEVSRAQAGSSQRQFRRDTTLRLLYAGNIGAKQDLLAVVDHIRSTGTDLRLRIHAAGRGAAEISARLAEHPDARIEVRPFLSEAGFIDALIDADLMVISERPSSGHSYMPSKLIPALATGTPVLTVSDPESSLGREVLEHALGPHLTWEDLKDLDARLAAITEDDLVGWSGSARAHAQNWDRQSLLDRIEADLMNLVGVAARRRRRIRPST